MERSLNRIARRAELSRNGNGFTVINKSGDTNEPKRVLVSSWTNSGDLYYYDLTHGKGREEIFLTIYDLTDKEFLNAYKLEPLVSNPEQVLRIWLSWNPASNQIRLLYF